MLDQHACEPADEPALVEPVVYLQGNRGVKAREGFIRTGMSAKQFDRAVAGLSSQGRIFNVDPAEKKFLHESTVDRIGGFTKRILSAHGQDTQDQPRTKATAAKNRKPPPKRTTSPAKKPATAAKSS